MNSGSEGKTELISRFNFTYIQIQAAKERRDKVFLVPKKYLREHALNTSEHAY